MVKKRIRQLLYILVNIRTYLFLEYYKIRNKDKAKIFLFTDSRGFEITRIKNRKSPFSSYVLYFVRNYCCDVYICPQKHTTTFDFLHAYTKHSGTPYKHVIAHIGVVDFSPRPHSSIAGIIRLKRTKIEQAMGSEFYKKCEAIRPYDEEYGGEQTAAILPEEHLPEIAARFNEIEGLIWISCNPVDTRWRGNYKRERPSNINMVNDKSLKLIGLLDPAVSIVDLTGWNTEEVHTYTCDNIHLSPEGMQYIETALKNLIRE